MGISAAEVRAAVKRRFAGREDAIEVVFRMSPRFRALCRDYLVCVAALERWQESASDEAPQRVHEYSELLAELTREVEVHLEAPRR